MTDSDATDEFLADQGPSSSSSTAPGVVPERPAPPTLNLPRTTSLPSTESVEAFDATDDVAYNDAAIYTSESDEDIGEDENRNVVNDDEVMNGDLIESVKEDAMDETLTPPQPPQPPVFPPSTSPQQSKEILSPTVITTLLDQVEQLRSIRSWGATIPIPNNTMISALDTITDVIRKSQETRGPDEEEQVNFVVEQIVQPVLVRTLLDDLPLASEDTKNVISCIYRFLTILLHKMKQAVADGIPLLGYYWFLFRICAECSNKFYTRVSQHQLNVVLPIVPGDLVFPSPIINLNRSPHPPHHWYVTTVVWFNKLKGFTIFKNYFTKFLENSTDIEQIYMHIEWTRGVFHFLEPAFLREAFEPVFDFIVHVVSNLSDDEMMKMGGLNFSECALYKLLNHIRTYYYYVNRGQNKFPDDYAKAKKMNHQKLIFFKTLIIRGNFQARMNAMDHLCGFLQMEDEIDLQPYDIEAYIKEIELVPTLFKDNLHHVTYIDRLIRVISTLLDRGLLDQSLLDVLWGAQQGKHDVIQRHMHILTGKLVAMFGVDLDNAFVKRIQATWEAGNPKEKETLLDLIKRVGMELFNIQDTSGIKYNFAMTILDQMWSWSTEILSEGLREKIYDVLIDILTEAVPTPNGPRILERMCYKAAERIVHSQEPIINGEDYTGLTIAHLKRMMLHFTDAELRFGEFNRRASMLKKLDQKYAHDAALGDPADDGQFSFGKLIVDGICEFIDMVPQENSEPPSESSHDSTEDSDYTSESSEDDNPTLAEILSALKTRLVFLEFLLQTSQRSTEMEANPWNQGWSKRLWNKLISDRHPAKLQSLGFNFFTNMIRFSDLHHEKEPLIAFFRENVLALVPATLTEKGFMCFESFLKAVNQVLGNLFLLNLPPECIDERDCQLVAPDFEGEEYLRKVIVESNDKTFMIAANRLVKFWCAPKNEDDAEEFVVAVVQKCATWLAEVDEERARMENAVQGNARIRRVISTLNDIVDRNEMEGRLMRRVRPTLRRAILGKGMKINVTFRSEDMQYLFRDARTPLHITKPIGITVHENMLLHDLVRQVCGLITNQGGHVTPYSLSLVRKGPHGGLSGNNRFGTILRFSDFGQTLKELSIEEHVHLVARVDKTKIGDDGRNDHSYCRFLEASEELTIAEEAMFSLQVVNNIELMQRILKLADDPDLIEKCMRLFCSLPVQEIEDFDNSADTFVKIEVFTRFLAALDSEESTSNRLYKLLQLYELLLPATLPNKQNGENLAAFFMANGVSVLIKMFATYADIEEPNELTGFMCETLLRLLPPLVFLFIATVTRPDSKMISNAMLDFLPTAKRFADPCVADVLKTSQLSGFCQDRDLALEVEEKDICAFLHIGLKFMHDSPRGCQLTNLLDMPLDFDQGLMDPCIDDSDGLLVSQCVYVFALLAAYSPEIGYRVLKEDMFRNFLVECCSDDEVGNDVFRSNELSVLIPELLSDIEKDRKSTDLIESTVDFLFSQLEVANMLLWELLGSLVTSFSNQGRRLRNLAQYVEEMIAWFCVVQRNTEETLCHYSAQHVLCGRLKLAYVLFAELNNTEKRQLGVDEEGPKMVERLLYNFLIPSSRAFMEKQTQESAQRIVRSHTVTLETITASSEIMDFIPTVPRSTSTCNLPSSTISVCKTDDSMHYAYELLTVFCDDPDCLRQVVRILKELFYTDRSLENISWDYQPDAALRSPGNFVGLKNGGATCYMNSILQQLYMIAEMRDTILNAPISDEEMEGGEEPTYQMKIVGALQSVFAHLAGSELESYTPDEFWKIFKLNERVVNVHEQQDAFEFFNTVVDLIDEGMEKIGSPKVGSKLFGGQFADEKICKDCPHKYSREEPFTSISIDVRSHNNIIDSLHEFVRGDILENDNAYHCEKCDKKVRAIKRLSIQKLPELLVVQLKRFEFDWEKNEPVKFNDYFEFPFQLNMKPYTAEDLAAQDNGFAPGMGPDVQECGYNLRGVLVHSGQATGGHYFSYIKNDDGKWFKFDDNDVTVYTCEPRDVKYKWFGEDPNTMNEFTGRRRGRIWWNAFLLFYEKTKPVTPTNSALFVQPGLTSGLPLNAPLSVDPSIAQAVDSSRRSSTASPVTRLHKRFSTMSMLEKFPMGGANPLRCIPPMLESRVRQQNTRIMHERNQYNHVFFAFMYRVVQRHLVAQPSSRNDDIYVLLADLYSHFLVYTCLHSSSCLRKEGDYIVDHPDWFDLIEQLVASKPARVWVINNIILNETITKTYLLQAKDQEIRLMYSRLIIRVLDLTYHLNDLIQDLAQRKTPYLNRVLMMRLKRNVAQPAIFLLVETLIGFMKVNDRSDKSFEVLNILAQFATFSPLPTAVLALIARNGILSQLLNLFENSSAANLGLNPVLVKLTMMLLRVVDFRHHASVQSITPLDPCPYLLVPVEEAVPSDQLTDIHQILTHFRHWGRDENNAQVIEFLIVNSGNDPTNNDWMQTSIKFVCWNQTEITRRLLDVSVRCLNQVNNTETGLTLLNSICYIKDANYHSRQRMRYLLSEVDMVNCGHHDNGYTRKIRNGLIGLVNVPADMRRMGLIRALVIVMDAFEDWVIDYLIKHEAEDFNKVIILCHEPAADELGDKPYPGQVPILHEAIVRFYSRYVPRFRAAEAAAAAASLDRDSDDDDSSCSGEHPVGGEEAGGSVQGDENMEFEDDSEGTSEEVEQPLDLTIAGGGGTSSRKSPTTPQGAEKRTLTEAEDETDSLSGQGEAKKSRIVPAESGRISAVDDEKLLLETSSSATEMQEINAQAPPPTYDDQH